MTRILIRAVVATGFLPLSAAQAADELQAGVARVDITPPTGFAMWGYAARKDTPSLGVRDPLRARALVLATGDQRIAIVSLDLGRAPTRASMAIIRARVKTAGIEHLFLVASHPHPGPVLEVDNWPSAKNSHAASTVRASTSATFLSR